jgi:NAD(P)-dependent dehydrogenase (short-subunit alcohol dehydrogenase family)
MPISAYIRSFDLPKADLDGKSILVTGGTGSFGQAFVSHVLANSKPRRIIVLSRDEQKRRLQARLDDPAKRWKWAPQDLEARARWHDFHEAYEEVLERTITHHAPWFVIPADCKWFRDAAVARVLVQLLEAIGPKAPKVDLDPATIVIPD